MVSSRACCFVEAHTPHSAHPPLPLPIPQYHVQDPAVRVSPSDLSRCDWRARQGERSSRPSLVFGVVHCLILSSKTKNSDVINFLLSTEIIPLCLRIMETGSELSKTVAIFIVQKILLDDLGLQYICQTYERFYAVGAVLANMVQALVESQAVRLLKHVVRCYLRMSDNPR